MCVYAVLGNVAICTGVYEMIFGENICGKVKDEDDIIPPTFFGFAMLFVRPRVIHQQALSHALV